MMDQRRVRASDFQHHLRKLLDRMEIVAADVVRLACEKLVCDVSYGAHSIGKVSRCPRMSAKNSPRQSVQRTIKKPAVHRTIRTVVLTWSISIEQTHSDRFSAVLQR